MAMIMLSEESDIDSRTSQEIIALQMMDCNDTKFLWLLTNIKKLKSDALQLLKHLYTNGALFVIPSARTQTKVSRDAIMKGVPLLNLLRLIRSKL